MKRMAKLFKLYLPFAKAGIQSDLAYKAQTFMWLFISFVDVFFVVFLYHAIYRNSPDGLDSVINGFTFYVMVLYMITSFVFSFVVNGGDTSWNIYTDIMEGTISSTLTKPVSYRLRHLFTYLGRFVLQLGIIVLPLFIIVYSVFYGFGFIAFEPLTLLTDVVPFFVLMLLAGLINDAISYFTGLMTFYTQHMFGINLFRNAVQGFLSGSMLPLAYMGLFGVVCSYTPFAFLNSTPVLTVMGKNSIQMTLAFIGIALAWVAVLELINHLVFRHCIKKLTVSGG